jgi:hypothetical protein
MAWTGFHSQVDDYFARGTAATTCNGWSTASASVVADARIADFSWRSFYDLPNWPLPNCSQAAQLYCLQE